jgi:hypothetical protein
MELAVGDSTEVELIFNSRGYKGEVHKRVAIVTNDTTAKQLGIDLTAEIFLNADSTYPLVISPPYLDFSPNQGEKVMENKVKLRNVSQEEIKLKIVDFPVNLLKVSLRGEKIKPAEEIELEVKLNKELEDDSFRRSITLELNDKAKTRFSIPVKREAKIQ